MDWCAPGVDLNLFANKHRSSKSAPVSATGEIGTQTYDKSKGKVDQGTDKRWTSTNGDAEYALSDIGPPQIGTISMKDGILFVQVTRILAWLWTNIYNPSLAVLAVSQPTYFHRDITATQI
jgi:hypothetical protein